MLNNLYDSQELQSDYEKECFTLPLKITDETLHASLENFRKDTIVRSLLLDKTWFKLSDRCISLEDIESELSQHNDIMLDVIRNGTTVIAQIEKMAYAAIDEVIADYEVQNVS